MRDFSWSPDSRYPDQRNDGNCNGREEAVAEIRARLNKVTLLNGERVTALGVNRESKEGPPGPKQDSGDCQATETDKSAAMGGYLNQEPWTMKKQKWTRKSQRSEKLRPRRLNGLRRAGPSSTFL